MVPAAIETFEFVNALDDLSPELNRAARLMIYRARNARARSSFVLEGGLYEACAYPLGKKTAWTVNAAPDWTCIARGVV